jgi:Sulfotransferase family
MPRSGTTWVATMLAAGGEVVYVNEPLNPIHPPGRSPGILRASVEHRFQYICPDNESGYLDAYRDLLALRYHPIAELRRNHRPTDVVRMAAYTSRFLAGRARGRRVMIADPFAVLSSEWFGRRLGCRVVVVVRHPLAAVSSRKRLGWRFAVGELRRQDLLVRDLLDPLGLEHLDPQPDLLGEGAQLWTVIHRVVAEVRDRIPEIHVVRHEDLSTEPLARFAELYERLGLEFGDRSRRAVRAATSGSNPAELDVDRPHRVRLDSRANLHNWRNRLTAGEVAQIRAICADAAAPFYPEPEWWPAAG